MYTGRYISCMSRYRHAFWHARGLYNGGWSAQLMGKRLAAKMRACPLQTLPEEHANYCSRDDERKRSFMLEPEPCADDDMCATGPPPWFTFRMGGCRQFRHRPSRVRDGDFNRPARLLRFPRFSPYHLQFMYNHAKFPDDTKVSASADWCVRNAH